MQRIFAAFALLFSVGCGLDPSGLVLQFPNLTDQMNAKHATIEVIIRPPAGNGDECSRWLAFDNPVTLVETSEDVDLVNGKPSKSVSGIPLGWQTVFVKVKNDTELVLAGCHTGNITAGGKFEVDLVSLTPEQPDMTVSGDAAADLAQRPPDMALHKTLSITVNELRTSTRKLMGVAASPSPTRPASPRPAPPTPAAWSRSTPSRLKPPLQITAVAPSTNGYAGAATGSGVTPAFTTDTLSMTMPIELDAPMATSNITATVSGDPGAKQYDLYWFGVNSIATDPLQSARVASAALPFMFAVEPISYRVAISEVGASRVYTIVAGDRRRVVGGADAGVRERLPRLRFALHAHRERLRAGRLHRYGRPPSPWSCSAAPTQAGVPIASPAPIADRRHGRPLRVPSAPSSVQGAAVIQTELTADGPSRARRASPPARGRHRHRQLQRRSTAAGRDGVSVSVAASDGVVDFTITATTPAGFTAANTVVHVAIYNSAPRNALIRGI